MTLFRVAFIGSVLLAGLIADAAAPAQAQGTPPCFSEFGPLRTEAEKRAAAIKTGSEHKVSREEMCGLFRRFSEAELKVVKYAEQNQAWCGIPPDAINQMKQNHAKTAETEHKICTADPLAGGGQAQRGPGLGEALGARLPTPDDTAKGRGTFDTLTGNPLK